MNWVTNEFTLETALEADSPFNFVNFVSSFTETVPSLKINKIRKLYLIL